jgi:DNA-binding XRE family transcriptional regulator
MLGLQRIEVAGKRFVLLEESDYERLCREAGEAVADDDVLPPLPKPDANGRFPAIEYTRVSLARNLIRDRKLVGLSQERLAELAGIRQETISRLESGKHTATPGTIAKIDRVIAATRQRMEKVKADVRRRKRVLAEMTRKGGKPIPLSATKKRLGLK